ncbi:MAG TPA: glycosyltransferase family 1 protein, partial [Caulobacteraceae bacterium]
MAVVYFDASRLFLRGGRSSPTGIDRVVFAYARWLRARPDVRLTPVWSRMGYLSRLPLKRFDAILERVAERPGAAAGEGVWPALVAALQHPGEHSTCLRPKREAALVAREARGYAAAGLSALASPAELRLEPGALFVNVNHYGLEHPGLLNRLATAGVRPAVLIHDLIPVKFPEYCSPGAAPRHERRIEASLRYADPLIANSAATAHELAEFADARGLPPRRCTVAPLGLEPAFADAAPLEAAPYFVCVGTIEPRKNLSLLLSLWRRLADRLGPETPRLVLIGRRGWENEAVVDQLERSPAVLKYVHEVSNLGDAQVARLIRGAAALLSPSFAEGYNLPVIEALSLSTPVIASDIAVHRELAAGAQLIDPLDGPAWLEALLAAGARRPP